MNERVKNALNYSLTFNDEGIRFGMTTRSVFFSYGDIKELKFKFPSLIQIAGIEDDPKYSKTLTFAYLSADKNKLKELVAFAHEKMKTAPRTKGMYRREDIYSVYGDSSERFLRVKRLSTLGMSVFKIKEEKSNSFSVTPDKLVYTGATVGGITTGGFHVQKGGVLMTPTNTGIWHIYYKDDRDKEPREISFINLTDEIFELVKKDYVIRKLIPSEDFMKAFPKSDHLLDVRKMNESTAKHLKDWLCGY